MCGIIGIFGEEALREYQRNLQLGWERLSHRGEDSYGVILQKEDGQVLAYKSLSKEALLSKLAEEEKAGEFNRDSLRWILAHNRKASVGGIKLNLAHPIYNKEEQLLVIHNGTKKSLASAFGTESDTEALGLIFTIPKRSLQVRLLDGVGVAFAVRKTVKGYRLYFHKDEERPLVLNKELGIFASEPFLEGDWWEIKNTPFKEIKHLKELELLADKNVSESVLLQQCMYCGKEFLGSGERYCKDCQKMFNSKTYYGTSGYGYTSYGLNSTTKKKK